MKAECGESKVINNELPFKHVVIGEAPSFEVVDYGTVLQIEKGVKLHNPPKNQTLRFLLPSGELLRLGNRSSLATFDTLIQWSIRILGENRKAQSFDRDYSIIIVSDTLYPQLLPSPQRPSWAGAYVTNDGYVVYHQDYLNAAFGQINPEGTYSFGGETFSTELFLRELMHEMDHSREVKLLFDNDASLYEWFYSHSLWWFEGQREYISGIALSPMSDQEFISKLGKKLSLGKFSCTQLKNSFWNVDGSPTARNFAYQYAARWVQELAHRLLDFQNEHGIKGSWEENNAVDMLEMITHEMIQAYKKGTFSGNILEFLSHHFGISTHQILQWEHEWQISLLDHTV